MKHRKTNPTGERRRLRAERERWRAEAAELAKRKAPQYEEAKREAERLGAEDAKAAMELLRHENLLVRACSDQTPLDWEGKLAIHGYDRAAHEEAKRRAETAERRAKEATDRVIALGNEIYFPSYRAWILSAELGESYEPARKKAAQGARAAQEAKAQRDAAIRKAVRDAALAMRRRNPNLSAARIAERLTAGGGLSIAIPDANKVIRHEVVGRELVSSVLREKPR